MPVYRRNGAAEKIVESLTMEEVAQHYGFEINRSGFMRCPFHKGDHTASLKVYPGNRGWCCFGCHKGGSVINFVMQLFDLNFRQAVMRINIDFNLGISAGGQIDPSEASRILQQRQKEQKELEEYRRIYTNMCIVHRTYWEALKHEKEAWEAYEAGKDIPLYFEAIKNLVIIENWFEDHPWR